MQREVAVASGGAQLSDDLRRDLLQCRRDLLEEKAKCKALTQRMLKLVQLDSSRRWRLRVSSCPPRHRRGAMLASRLTRAVSRRRPSHTGPVRGDRDAPEHPQMEAIRRLRPGSIRNDPEGPNSAETFDTKN